MSRSITGRCIPLRSPTTSRTSSRKPAFTESERTMVEFALPKNSKVTEGKTWPHPAKAKVEHEYRVYRWNPDDGANPRIDTYYVNTDDCGPMILDGLIWLKNNVDATLTFRRSCREGICGSCALNIDGTNLYAQPASIQPWLQTVSPTPQKEWKQSHDDRAKLDGLYECIL